MKLKKRYFYNDYNNSKFTKEEAIENYEASTLTVEIDVDPKFNFITITGDTSQEAELDKLFGSTGMVLQKGSEWLQAKMIPAYAFLCLIIYALFFFKSDPNSRSNRCTCVDYDIEWDGRAAIRTCYEWKC